MSQFIQNSQQIISHLEIFQAKTSVQNTTSGMKVGLSRTLLSKKTYLAKSSKDKAYNIAQDNRYIAIVNAKSEEDAAITLRNMLLRVMPKATVTVLQQPKTQEQTHQRLKILDEVDMAVALLSPRYVTSAKLVEELHIMLFRQRSNPSKCIFFPIYIYELPKNPVYFRLLNCRYACFDLFWDILCTNSRLKTLVESVFSKISIQSQLALACAAVDIFRYLYHEGNLHLRLYSKMIFYEFHTSLLLVYDGRSATVN